MKKIRKAVSRFIRDFKKLPERKQYIEFFTALLSVPVLMTVLILNVTNLKSDKKEEPNPTETVHEVVITQPSDPKSSIQPSVTACIEEIGPVSIDNPSEGETVSDNPVQVSITYKKGKYCAVVWSYRVNGGRWSDYDDNSVALFNPPKGRIQFELRVKSVVTGEQKTLSRTFTYNGSSDNTASGSAN